MASLWTRGGLTWRQLLGRLWVQSFQDEILGRAAELSYFFFFAVFPLLLFLTSLLGYLTESSQALRQSLFTYLSQISPSPAVTALLRNTLREVSAGRGGGKLSLGLVGSVWLASNGVLAIGRTLNAACGFRETRRWWKRRLVSLGLTGVTALFTVAALALVLYGTEIGESLADAAGIGDLFTSVWNVLQWPIVLAFLLAAFELLYNFAPAVPRGGRAWLTPGAVVAVLLWVVASLGFRFYVSYARELERFSTTYGSLGVVIILMLWFYLAGLSILVGGEVNSEIARAIQEEAFREAREARREEEADGEGERAEGDAGSAGDGEDRPVAEGEAAGGGPSGGDR